MTRFGLAVQAGRFEAAGLQQREVVPHLRDYRDFITILQVLPDTWPVGDDWNAEAGKLVAGANARELEDLWTVEGATRDDNLAGNPKLLAGGPFGADLWRTGVCSIKASSFEVFDSHGPVALECETACKPFQIPGVNSVQ